MADIAQEIGSSADAPPKPCEYFDLVGGSGMGGIIALMLGLLGMVIAMKGSSTKCV
jgi:patatin-like phospholipase/acyl hydrolase